MSAIADICAGVGRTRVSYDGVDGTLIGYRWDTEMCLVRLDRPAVVLTIPLELLGL